MASRLFEQANSVISKRREMREALIEKRKEEVFSKIPRVRDIEKNLDATGIKMLSVVMEDKISVDDAIERIAQENRSFIKERNALLVENGFPKDYLDVEYICDKCKDSGFVEGNLCSCLKKELTNAALCDANLAKIMQNQTFETFSLDYYSTAYDEQKGCSSREMMQNIYAHCKDFVHNFDNSDENLLFYGGSGLGKTFLSSAIANALIAQYKDVLYISANTLFPILENIHFGRDISEKSTYLSNKAMECDLLILDDLGAEFVTSFTSSELFRIVNSRLLNGQKMLFSTNLNYSELTNTYSERIVSRMIGNFTAMEFFGEDIRKKIKFGD